MYLRTLLIVLALSALALFTAVNWSAFIAPTTLSVIFASVEAPLGLVLLSVVVALAGMFLIYVVYLQSSVLIETRRHNRELQSQRELADHAEISRIQDLRSFLETQLKIFGQQTERSQLETSAKLDRLESELRQSIEQCQNSLAASMAEIDDRLEHGAGESQTRKLA
jgi:type III secretory pathway component EscR